MTSVPGSVDSPRPVTPLGILTAKLDLLSRKLEATGVDPELESELREARELAGGLEPYLGRCTTPESDALSLLAQRTHAEDWNGRSGADSVARLEREMLSGHVEGQMLKMLVHATRARRVLDIGMFTGYSALAMAEALPGDGEVIACELDPGVAEFARRCFRESDSGHKISVRVGPASSTLGELADTGETFDLVFLDADKAGYADYLAILLDTGMLASNGVICVDNTLMQGQPYVSGESSDNGSAIEAFNRTVADDPRVEQVMIPLRDGLTLIRRAGDDK